MTCKYCGSYIGENTTVCPECGQKSELVYSGQTCLYCGYKGKLEPAGMVRWYEWCIIFATFPLGLFYLFYIFMNRKNQGECGYKCPSCKKISKISNSSVDKEKMKNVVKTIATDKEVRKSLSDVKRSIKDWHDTL